MVYAFDSSRNVRLLGEDFQVALRFFSVDPTIMPIV
jgi:hypothetical protein